MVEKTVLVILMILYSVDQVYVVMQLAHIATYIVHYNSMCACIEIYVVIQLRMCGFS